MSLRPDMFNVSLNFVATDYELPRNSQEYLCICKSGRITTLTYDVEHKHFCYVRKNDGSEQWIDVLYWAKYDELKEAAWLN